LNPVVAVHVADAAAHRQSCSDKTPPATVDLEFLTSVGLNEMVPQWMTL
jgi:hypothetical protein